MLTYFDYSSYNSPSERPGGRRFPDEPLPDFHQQYPDIFNPGFVDPPISGTSGGGWSYSTFAGSGGFGTPWSNPLSPGGGTVQIGGTNVPGIGSSFLPGGTTAPCNSGGSNLNSLNPLPYGYEPQVNINTNLGDASSGSGSIDWFTGDLDMGFEPVILDLDGNGERVAGVDSSNTWFDMDGDGGKQRTAWAAIRSSTHALSNEELLVVCWQIKGRACSEHQAA